MGYHSLVFMYDPGLQPVVLGKLAKWGRLTESDLQTMLPPIDRVKLTEDLLKDLEWEGLVTIRVVGDEPVISITDRGRAWIEQHGGRGSAPPGP
jgi:DNA-binding HxlR family transcriptional regulator